MQRPCCSPRTWWPRVAQPLPFFSHLFALSFISFVLILLKLGNWQRLWGETPANWEKTQYSCVKIKTYQIFCSMSMFFCFVSHTSFWSEVNFALSRYFNWSGDLFLGIEQEIQSNSSKNVLGWKVEIPEGGSSSLSLTFPWTWNWGIWIPSGWDQLYWPADPPSRASP